MCILSHHKTYTCHAKECARGQASKTGRGSLGSMFCCVVGLCPDNLGEAWGTDREWFLNHKATLFINSGISVSSYSYLPI